MSRSSHPHRLSSLATLLLGSFLMVACRQQTSDDAEETGLQAAIAESRAEWPDRDIDTIAGRLIGQWEATDAGPAGHMNTRWFAADGSCALQTRWAGRNEEPAPPRIGTYEVVDHAGDRIDVVVTWPSEEQPDAQVIWNFTIDQVARFMEVSYVRTEGAEITKGEPFSMRYVSTDEKP